MPKIVSKSRRKKFFIKISKTSYLSFFNSLVLTGILLAYSCSEDQHQLEEDFSDNGKVEYLTNIFTAQLPSSNEGMIELGKEINDPYKYENMLEAYQQVKSDDKDKFEKIKPTHLYIRFLPKDEKEWLRLKEDTNLILYDFPLHYEITNLGTSYHDPSLPAEAITWQYTVVEKDYKYPKNVKHEVIYKVYIPPIEEGEVVNDVSKSNSKENSFYKELEYTSFVLTGNIQKTNGNNKLKSTSGLFDRWHPEGRVRVYDDAAGGYIPLQGAQVHARYTTHIEIDLSDTNGEFRMGGFLFAVNYAIKWERSEYDIRDGDIGQAWYNGPQMVGDWFPDIGSATSTGKSINFATIHRAAYRFFYGDNGGLPNDIDFGKLKYIYKHESGSSEYNPWGQILDIGLLADIRIFGMESNIYRPTDDVFSSVCHENGHAINLQMMNGSKPYEYSLIEKFLRESWAQAVEYYISRIEYTTIGISGFEDPANTAYSEGDHKQHYYTYHLNHSKKKYYSPLYIDLVDNYNQSYKPNNGASLPSNRCPDGGTFDGVNCWIGTPPTGETGFVYDDNLYYTPVGCCDCPVLGASFDNANCHVMDIPENTIGWYDSYYHSLYLAPSGDYTMPNDHVTGYTFPQIATQFLKLVQSKSDLKTKLKQNKPVGMTDKHIDLLFNFYE